MMSKKVSGSEFEQPVVVAKMAHENPITVEVNAIELSAWLKDPNQKVNLIDVREPYEREIAHIGGESMPLSQFKIEEFPYDKEDLIVIYCKMGGRSLTVLKLLKAHGYKKVYSLKGGITAWMEEIGL